MDMFQYAFMQKALLAALLIGVLCSVISVYVVLKKLSFIGVGISHSAFGGVAIGFWAGVNPITVAIPFAVATAMAIGLVSRRGRITEDVAIGIFYATAMALGVLFIGLSTGYNIDLFSYLFGSILAVTNSDLWLIGFLGLGVLLIILLLFKEFFFLSFDEEMARVNGLPVELLYYLLLCMMAITVVVAIKIVGIILVSALLVIPGATAFQITRNFKLMMLLSVAVGVTCGVVGLILSYHFDLAPGATIVLTATGLFIISLLFSPQRRKKARITQPGKL